MRVRITKIIAAGLCVLLAAIGASVAFAGKPASGYVAPVHITTATNSGGALSWDSEGYREAASAALAEAAGQAVVIDAYDAYGDFTTWLQSAGFEPQRPLYRMRREGNERAEGRRMASVTEFAILGPEFG